MTNEQLLAECKKGLNIQAESLEFDGVLTQKIAAVKVFLQNAGVSTEALGSDLAVAVIVMGVADLWSVEGGGVKFSPALYTLATQLAMTGGATSET